MKDDKTIDDLVEVDRKECMSAMYQTLKAYNVQQQKLIDGKSRILNFLNEASTYEALGFKVKYFFDNKGKGYTFSYEEKEDVGFRK